MSSIGIQIGASTAPGDLVGAVRRAEELGYSEIWLAEDYFELGGVAAASTALASTQSIPVGLGVVSAVVRHPGVTAMEYATLGGAYPGRFMGGLGHGAPDWVRQMGLTPASPIGLLREATEAIRQLLEGATVTSDGTYFELDGVRLDHPPSVPVPLYYGVQGPVSLRLSGELVDGTLLGWFSSAGSVAWARELIDEGRKRGERDDLHEVAVLCLLSLSTDAPEEAARRLANWSAPMLSKLSESPPMKSCPEGEELGALVAAVGKEALGAEIPLRVLRQFAAVGDLDDCAETVQSLLDGGADRVILVPNPAGFRSTTEMLDQMTQASALV